MLVKVTILKFDLRIVLFYFAILVFGERFDLLHVAIVKIYKKALKQFLSTL